MIKIEIQGLQQLREQINGLSERRLNAAVATAMTRTAVKTRDKVQAHMRVAFDAPTPYTVCQLRYVAATAQRPVAAVGFNIAPIQDVFGNVVRYEELGAGQTPAGKYLQFQADGGQRRAKRFENALRLVGVLPAGWYAVPGQRAKVDSYGNQSVGELRQILSWFDAAELVAGSRQNMRSAGRAKRAKGTRKTAGWEYFAVQPGARRAFARASGKAGGHSMAPGIYRRTAYAMGSRIEPVVIFVRGTSYRKRFDFDRVAAAAIAAALPAELQTAIQQTTARLQQRAGT